MHTERLTGADVEGDVLKHQPPAVLNGQVAHRNGERRHCAASSGTLARDTQRHAATIEPQCEHECGRRDQSLIELEFVADEDRPDTRGTPRPTRADSPTSFADWLPGIVPGRTSTLVEIASASSHPMPPENRGSRTVIAHGSVETRPMAAQVPDASRIVSAPPRAVTLDCGETEPRHDARRDRRRPVHERHPDAAMSAREEQVVVTSSGRHLEAGRGREELQQEHRHHRARAA